MRDENEAAVERQLCSLAVGHHIGRWEVRTLRGDVMGGCVIRLATGVFAFEFARKATALGSLVVLTGQGKVCMWCS